MAETVVGAEDGHMIADATGDVDGVSNSPNGGLEISITLTSASVVSSKQFLNLRIVENFSRESSLHSTICLLYTSDAADD